ncbi:hypothetical protein EWM64_g8690 [Hericium alpestre]|uniref:F-box domain-containing protein n=1 Tax=Hericium alpestre TaxID=135208 RepID=A0A4Y9ZKQ3_9AGAM|nr:hypothetical protein EWM64_g8690 [Hericium alpestre]
MDRMRNNALARPNILGDRDQLGQQLALLSASMDAVKARINALAPISRLPHELLAAVFSLLLDDERTYWSAVPSDLSKRRPRALRLGWIRVTHVCRAWRHVALDFRALWRDITFSLGSRWAQCMFGRAKNAPLSILAHLGSPLYALEDVLRIDAHLAHTHSLTLSASNTCLPSCLQRLVSPAPFLHTLSLTVDHFGLGPEAVVIAPADLFSGSTPNLRCVSLRNVFIPWTSSLFSNLSSLSIMLAVLSKADGAYFWDPPEPVDDDNRTPDLAPFLEALDRMSGLESLTIQGALPHFEDTMAFTGEQFNLPRLKSLDLGGQSKT